MMMNLCIIHLDTRDIRPLQVLRDYNLKNINYITDTNLHYAALPQ